MISVTQFEMFTSNGPFSRSGSHILCVRSTSYFEAICLHLTEAPTEALESIDKAEKEEVKGGNGDLDIYFIQLFCFAYHLFAQQNTELVKVRA